MTNKVIIALDFANSEQALQFLSQFQQQQLFVKVGMELYYQTGPQFIKQLQAKGHQIFLDLKLHDIPNTVYKATLGLANLGVDLITVHAAGGKEMMQASKQAIMESSSNSKILAITQLTSTTQQQMNQQQMIPGSLFDSVNNYCQLAVDAGVDGVVCSALETAKLHQQTPTDFLLVNPGIRLDDDQAGDQQRIATPRLAKEYGASYIVVGRPITLHHNPVARYQLFKQQFQG